MSAPARHRLHTQEGKNRLFKAPTPQLELIEPSDEEKALRALYKRLNFFPTKAWPIRAVVHYLLSERKFQLRGAPCGRVLDPCAGQGHMTYVLRAEGFHVDARDIHDFGRGFRTEDFLTADYGAAQYDWVIMNPPFSENEKPGTLTIADKFIAKAMTLAPEVLVFGRLAFETPGVRHPLMSTKLDARYVFCERVPMALGRIAKKGAATDYCWYHFRRDRNERSKPPFTHYFGPGTRDRFTRKGDA